MYPLKLGQDVDQAEKKIENLENFHIYTGFFLFKIVAGTLAFDCDLLRSAI